MPTLHRREDKRFVTNAAYHVPGTRTMQGDLPTMPNAPNTKHETCTSQQIRHIVFSRHRRVLRDTRSKRYLVCVHTAKGMTQATSTAVAVLVVSSVLHFKICTLKVLACLVLKVGT